ncbi:zinc finger protein 318 isoform X2 [Etheostoma spectabile]|uniref:zinc finger protein 318 isoform X2 n=1 Tax=Etheostoma spectabile TaxID=54343 RepID=UPI0013AFE21A|nr:zinc finger protein 318 isoform X2 [Etheostoma spectabile]
MYRGRPPPRGGYPPPFEGRGPRPQPGPGGYRDDRTRPRPPYHPGYHDHGPPPDPYRRSPPRRRYPSPGSGSHRAGEFWAGGPPRERSPSPRGLPPIDHNLVITVGNELIGPSGSAPSRHQDRDYPPRPEYERSRSRPQSRSPDRSRAKSLGRSKSQLRSKSRGRSQSRSLDRGRSQSRSPDRSRAKSRGRSRSRSPGRGRAKSRGRSRSRSPDRSRAKSRGRSRSRSPDRSRAKSRGRSRSQSPDRSRAKSRGRSKSRPQSRSRSRSRSRGRSYSRAASRGRSKSRPRSRSSSSSSSSSSGSRSEEKPPQEFRELQTARRRKELEEMLGQPTKSILKRRNDSEDSPSLKSCESPRGPDGSGLSRVAEQLLQAVKGMEPHAVAAMLSELRADPQMAHRAGLDAEIKEILHLLGAPPTAAERPADDIDDEEKFLYGDADEPKAAPAPEPVRLDLYGDVTEEALYADYPPQMYGPPPGAAPPQQAPPTKAQVDVRYASPDQVPAAVGGGVVVPPGTEPLADGERQALEEYEKIQDLLKTIGLDLGVSEISKMAARTKERLHGNKPPPKTPTRRRRYSSGSSGGGRQRKRRSHSSSSSSSSRSWSSEAGGRHTKTSALPKSHREANSEQSAAVAPQPPHEEPLVQPPDATVLPPHAGVPIPTYPPSQVHPGMLAPSFPPPGYSQYGNYLPYMHQQWPPMYPPPSIALPPHSPEDFPPALPYKHPYNKMAAAEPGAKGLGKTSAADGEKGKTSSGHDRRVSEEQNNESQKQKVLEEREKLKQERDVRMKKKEYLMKELERLRKQQGELLRRKRRERDGHKDPLLGEIGRLQEDVMGQISSLRREHEAAERSRNEIDKIALILGLLPTDRPRRTARPPEDPEEPPPPPPPPEKKKRELAPAARSPEGRTPPTCSTVKTASSSSSSSSSSSPAAAALSAARAPPAPPAPPQAPPPEPFEYYDAGNHWCKNCNVTSGSMFDFFTHLHSKTHRKTLDPYERPWASSPSKAAKTLLTEEKLTKPAKGSEFLLPVRGFFCLLCNQFYGDAICAEEHVTTHAHNDKYKRQMYENPLYEQRRNLDRQAGLASETSGKKRKHEEDEKGSKDREDKPKHKKDKRDKKKDEDAGLREDKVKKDAEEEKPGKKEKDGFRKSQSLEEERPSYSRKDEEDGRPSYSRKDEEDGRPSYSRKDEEEKYRGTKKEEKPRSSREEEDRGKYRGRDNDDRYYIRDEEYRPRSRRDDEDRPKYGPRDEEYKHGKYSDPRPRYDRDEGKGKAEKQPAGKPAAGKLAAGKPEAGKPVAGKPEAPPKPYEQPRIFSGPSPAMRAKLRKQSQETGKPAAAATPAAATPTFGKFTWKKKENVLAKEAEKVAAEFIKDDEEAAKQRLLLPEDSFAKSMAVAKEIAQKLGGQQSVAPPWVSNGANRGRIRPNLPGPTAFMRKTAMLGKPAPLNTFLSMRPENTGLLGPVPQEPPPISDGLAKALNAQNTPPPIGPPGTSEGMPPPTASKPASSQAKATQSGSAPASVAAKPPPPGSGPPARSGPASLAAKAPPAGSGPASLPANPPLSGPGPVVAKLPPPVCNPAPPVSKPTAPSEPTQSPLFPRPALQNMVKIVSDVAAPGVPESEQTRTVFVKPPPFMNRGDGAQKSDKLKTHLAAAKAQDLFDIFYPGQSGASSFTKPAKDTKPEGTVTNKRPLPVPEAPKPEPQPPSRPQPQPIWKSPDPDSPSRQTQPDSDIQIESVWSEASTPTDQFQAGISPQNQPPTPKPGSQITLAQSEPQNQSPTPKPESQITLAQSEPQNQSPTPKPESQITLAQSEPQNQPPTPKPWSQITLAQSVPQNQPPTPKPESQITLAQSEPQNQLPTPKPESQMNAPTQFEVQSVPQNQTLYPKSESQIGPETHPAEPELSFLNKTAPPPDQDPHPHQETHHDAAPEPEPKPSPKTRGKAGPGKRTPPATRPVRQTRSQTRYQTRQQHESPSEPETKPDVGLVLGDSDPDPEPRPLALDPGSGLEDPPMMEITPETLGLPPDMTALDFDYDFNFE